MRNKSLLTYAEKIESSIQNSANHLIREHCRQEWRFIKENALLRKLHNLHTLFLQLQQAEIPHVLHCAQALTSTLFHHLGIIAPLPLKMDLNFKDWIRTRTPFLPCSVLVRSEDFDRIRSMPILSTHDTGSSRNRVSCTIRTALLTLERYHAEDPREYTVIPDIVFHFEPLFTTLCRCRTCFRNTVDIDTILFSTISTPLFLPENRLLPVPLTEQQRQKLKQTPALSFQDFRNILLCPEDKLKSYPNSFFRDYPEPFLQNCCGFLEESRGVLLFKEQVIQLFQSLSLVSRQRAEETVEEILKEKELPLLREVFLNGCIRNGLRRREAALIWNRLNMELPLTVARATSLPEHILLWELLFFYNHNPETVLHLSAQSD